MVIYHGFTQRNLMLDILEKYHNDGLLHKQTHPTLDLTIWNYTPKVQYESLWDDITLRCRGLITNSKGQIIARPFVKFFNYEELVGNKWKYSLIPDEHFEVFEKMDGSLGIVFNYNNKWNVATRGSFISEQSIMGTEILKQYDVSKLDIEYTYLFEIIYPENRIVVDYGGIDTMVLLGAIRTIDDVEINIHDDYYPKYFNVVKSYTTWGEDWEMLKKEIQNDREGYVIRFSGGMRMKIKGDEYCRLHKVLTNITSRDIWEYLKDGKSFDEVLEKVPDEFYKWVKNKISSFEYGFENIRNHCEKVYTYFRYGKYNDKEVEPTKKEFALHLVECNVELHYRPILFAMWDNKPYDHIIWRIMRPKHEKPFKDGE